jgi:hypothetical protein
MTRSLGERGCAQLFAKFGFSNFIKRFFWIFYADFERFFPKNEDLEPFLRLNLGRKLG